MTTLHWAWVIVGAGIGTYVLRAAPFLWERLYRLGRNNIRFLTYVSFALAAGIVARSVVLSGGEVAAEGDIAIKLAAVAAALAVHRLIRNTPAALFAGVGVAVLLKAVVS